MRCTVFVYVFFKHLYAKSKIKIINKINKLNKRNKYKIDINLILRLKTSKQFHRIILFDLFSVRPTNRQDHPHTL